MSDLSERIHRALEYQFSQLVDETGHNVIYRAAGVAAEAAGEWHAIASRAIENASYALNPNQGERPDPVTAAMWLRTAFPPDHPSYVSPDDPLLAGSDFAGRGRGGGPT